MDIKKAGEYIENEQRDRYLDIVEEYSGLNGKSCWRVMRLPEKIDPVSLPQLGKFWSIEERTAAAHWG